MREGLLDTKPKNIPIPFKSSRMVNSPAGQHNWSYRHHNSGSAGVWVAAWAEAACSEKGISWWRCSPSKPPLPLQRLRRPAFVAVADAAAAVDADAAAAADGSSWRLQSKLLPHSPSMRYLEKDRPRMLYLSNRLREKANQRIVHLVPTIFTILFVYISIVISTYELYFRNYSESLPE